MTLHPLLGTSNVSATEVRKGIRMLRHKVNEIEDALDVQRDPQAIYACAEECQHLAHNLKTLARDGGTWQGLNS